MLYKNSAGPLCDWQVKFFIFLIVYLTGSDSDFSLIQSFILHLRQCSGFPLSVFKQPAQGFFVVTMLITGLTIHSTWSEHTYINFFFGHFHSYIHSFRFAQAQNVMKMVSLSLFFLYNSSCRELGILQITGR